MIKDICENNNDIRSATVLEKLTGTIKNLTIHDGADVDYYKITFLRSSKTTANSERISLAGQAAGEYYVVMKGADEKTRNAYNTLSWDVTGGASAEKQVGYGYSSLFAINDAKTEYGYVMGHSNLSVSDFSVSKPINRPAGVRLTYVHDVIIDAQKSTGLTNSRNQCWGGAASNMLAWSGWGEQGIASVTGNKAEDVIFSHLNPSWANAAGNADDGVRWFFNGSKFWSSNTIKAGTGNYLGQSAEPVLTHNNLHNFVGYNPSGEVASLHDMAGPLTTI